jgi:adenylate cyclase
MKQTLKAIIEAGIRPQMSPRQARFVKASNLIAIISAVWVMGSLPTFIPYLPATRDVILTTVACALGLCFTPLINSFRFYRAAQLYAPTIAMLTVAFNALYFGHQAWNDLLLIAVILIAFYYVESLYILLWVTGCAGALFVGVESWYAYGHQGFLEGLVPDQFLITIRNASVYSVAFLTIAFAYYNRAVLNSTQQALDRESARSESLLLNILPKSIAERLKNSTELIADRVPEVSIVFADLVGFTEISPKNGCRAACRYAERDISRFRSRRQAPWPGEDKNHRRRLYGCRRCSRTACGPRRGSQRNGFGHANARRSDILSAS